MKNIFALLFCFLGLQTFAQLTPIYDSIPVSDGKKLAITRYSPSGCVKCPTIFIQTPYNRLTANITGLPLGVGFNINAANYNFVIMDWRGFYANFSAAYVGSPTRGEDGYDAVEWIASQTWSDTVVGTWGPSALGKVQFETAKKNPPHLKCMVPLVAGPQTSYNDYYPGAVYRTEYVEQLDALGFGVSAGVLSYPVYGFAWTFTENSTFYPDSIQVPTFMIGGWYDHNVELMLPFFNAIRATTTGVQTKHRLLMGPWVHGGHSVAHVGSAAQGELFYYNAENQNDTMALQFFDYHLRGVANGWDTTQFIKYYQMGENNWKTSAVWPPVGLSSTNLYLHTDNSMDGILPTNATGSQNVVYDPNDPSPTIGGCTLRADLNQGPYDQVPLVESRADILTFTTMPFGADVVMKGKAQAHLKVSSNKKDTDFAIRLTDIYPDGRSMLLVDAIKRMRFRDGLLASDTSVMIPGTIYDAVIDLPSTCNTFLAGHRIRVDITSSIYPKYNRNANTGGVMYPGLSGDSLINPQTATNTIYLNSTNASYITLPLIDYLGSIEERAENIFEMKLFPNPATTNTTIEIKLAANETVQLMVFDISGKQIFNDTKNFAAGTNQYVLNTKSFAKGLYHVSVLGKDGRSVCKLIVQ
jgi:predicted acyl esterase